MLQQDEGGVGGGDGDGAVDDGDDDPDEVQRDDDDDADDFPSPGGNFPAGSPCQRALSLSMVSVPWRRRNISWTIPPTRFSGRQIYAKGQPGGWSQVASP